MQSGDPCKPALEKRKARDENPEALACYRICPIQPKLHNPWVLEERKGFVPLSWSWSCAEASFSLSVVRKVTQSGGHQKPPEYSALRAWRQPRHKPGVPMKKMHQAGINCFFKKRWRKRQRERDLGRNREKNEGRTTDLLISNFQSRAEGLGGEMPGDRMGGAGVLQQNVLMASTFFVGFRAPLSWARYSCHTALEAHDICLAPISRAQTRGHHTVT